MSLRAIEQLERAVVDDPDDRELRLVLADAFNQNGGTRGELIVLGDLVASGIATPDQRGRERELRRALQRTLLDAQGHDRFSRLHWHAGFVERIDINLAAPLDLVARYLAHRELQFVRELDLRWGWPEHPVRRRNLVAQLVDLVGHLPLRWIGLGDGADVAEIRTQLRTLRGIGLNTASALDGLVTLRGLRDVELGAPRLSHRMLERVIAAVPRDVERLVLHTTRASVAMIDELLEPGEFPRLRHLGVIGGEDELAVRLCREVRAGTLRLASLGFSMRDDPTWRTEIRSQLVHLPDLRLFTAPRDVRSGWINAWHALGDVYAALGRPVDALDSYEACTMLSGAADHWIGVGDQLLLLGARAEAYAAFEAALAWAPGDPRALAGRARAAAP